MTGELGTLASNVYGHEEILKNLLLCNYLSDIEIISQACSLGDPFRNLFTKFWCVKKHGPSERGLLTDMRKFLQIFLLLHRWSHF